MTVEKPPMQSSAQAGAGWYKKVFAWLMAQGANDDYEKALSDRKQALFSNLHGDVVEIGPGAGPNLRHYPRDIHLIGIEPNPYMHPYLQAEAEKLGINVDIHPSTAEKLDFADNSVDAVVSTLVLCSVPDLPGTLQEILRVLKPGGRFFFLEHVAAPQGTWLRRVQSGIKPIWKPLADGCHPDRETWVALEKAGFKSVDYQHFRAPSVPAIVSPQIIGVATK